MTYISICSGIEAASVAWHPLGWKPLAFSEIEPFPSAVLAHHWPEVPNMGDMTKHHDWPDTLRPDIIVGGTPCQAFSVAGLRKGLADPRGNLTLTFLSILARYRPRWVVWENVPGVLSDKTGAFGSFLGGLGELGYGFAYRVLDAQYFGVPQRRRRVFVVGCLGDWRRAAAVLFERQSLQGNPPPRRNPGKGTSADLAPCLTDSGRGVARTGDTRGQDPVIAVESYALQAGTTRTNPASGPNGTGVVKDLAYTLEARKEVQCVCMSTGQAGAEIGIGIGTTLNCNHEAPIITVNTGHGHCSESQSAGTLSASPRDHHESNLWCVHGTQEPCSHPDLAFTLGRNSGQENAIAFAQNGDGEIRLEGGDGTRAGTLSTGGGKPGQGYKSIAFERRMVRTTGGQPQEEINHCLRADENTGDAALCVATLTAVRRLTPTECERLQGFPDHHTRITGWNGWRDVEQGECIPSLISLGLKVRTSPKTGKSRVNDPDGPRYKALGNSMAVPVMRWIGQRISFAETL